MTKKIMLGDEAIVQGALEAGVDFVSGYPGCPSAEIGEGFKMAAKNKGLYVELSINEKVALEAAIGASFSGLRAMMHMKSFGINVCSDSLFPLAYTGVKAGLVIVVADDPSCWSSAQTEQDSRGYAYLSHIPFLEPSDPQEAKDFTKHAFEISEKFSTPVILRITTRVAHQRAVVEMEETKRQGEKKMKQGEFVRDYKRFATMPPRVLEMKKELLEKIEKIRQYFEKSEINKIENFLNSAESRSKLGVIASGVSYLYVKEALKEMNLDLPVLKLGLFYPLPEKKIKDFTKHLEKILVVEELEPYIEKEIKILHPKIEVFGKNVLPIIGELNQEKVALALSRILGLKHRQEKIISLDLPARRPQICQNCPYWFSFSVLKKYAPEGTIFGGDIGCYMLAGLPPHNIQDYLFSMGSSIGIGHGIKKSTKQKVIALIGDGTFFHAGIPALINAVYNKSNLLIFVLDNRITAMTGLQPNPGMGRTEMGEEAEMIKIEDIAKACGVKNIKVLDPININELKDTIKEFLNKEEVSVIIARRICYLLEKKQKNG